MYIYQNSETSYVAHRVDQTDEQRRYYHFKGCTCSNIGVLYPLNLPNIFVSIMAASNINARLEI